MATGKRYYWIKLKESFLTSDAVDFLMGQPDGANYVVLYQILCLKTINTGGKLERHIGEVIIPYDEAKIQRDAKWFTIDTVRVALNLYKALGLVYMDRNGTLALADYENLVGSETDYAEKNRRQRAQQILPGGHNVSSDVSTDVSSVVSENVSTDIDNRDKRIDIENREQSKEKEDTEGGTEPQAAPVLTIPLNDGSEFPISAEYAEEMQKLYPAVDVMQQLRSMRAWSLCNPERRKTKRGVKSFINRWLSSEQDKAAQKKAPGRKVTTFMDL